MKEMLYEVRYSDTDGEHRYTFTKRKYLLSYLSEILTSDSQKLLSVVNHGKVVGYRQDPWHDVTIYEDGYEDRFYIGE